MAALSNTVFDDGLSVISDNAENLYLLSADPGLIWSNIASYALGSKATPTIAAPSDRTGGGREVVISMITNGSATSSGDATHYALTDDSASEILVSGVLSGILSLTSGASFATEEFSVGMPDPT